MNSELSIYPLQKYYKSTGAKDHPFFWVNGASNLIPNLSQCINLTGFKSNIKDIETFENENQNTLKDLFIKHGSDKFIHSYYKFYSKVLFDKRDINILEIGIGTKNPSIPSTMFFYKQDKDFDSSPGSSLRAFRDFVPNSNIYGADIDKDILFEEDRIKTEFVDQLDNNTIKDLFKDINFDFIVIDGLHHITADLNSVLHLINRINNNGIIVVEDINILEPWLIIDFIFSKIEGISTYIIKDIENYMYVINKN
jgi:hypothetical protein